MTTTTVLELLDALRTHLAEFEVPAPWSVHACLHGPDLTAQLSGHDAPQTAARLLAWADTLTEPTTEAWRVPHGDSVHLSVSGRLSDGTGIRVYGGVPFTDHGPGGGLTPGETAPILLGALRHLAELDEVPTR